MSTADFSVDFASGERTRVVVGPLSLLPDLAVREACRCRLKGLPGEHPLYEVLVPGSPAPVAAQHELTARELDVLALIARGLPNREIAAALHLSEKTVKTHVSSILAKLQVADRTQAALLAVRRRLVAIDSGGP